MKILHGYVEPVPELKPVLMYGVVEGKPGYWRPVGPAWPTPQLAQQYMDSRDMSLYDFTQKIVRIWRYQ